MPEDGEGKEQVNRSVDPAENIADTRITSREFHDNEETDEFGLRIGRRKVREYEDEDECDAEDVQETAAQVAAHTEPASTLHDKADKVGLNGTVNQKLTPPDKENGITSGSNHDGSAGKGEQPVHVLEEERQSLDDAGDAQATAPRTGSMVIPLSPEATRKGVSEWSHQQLAPQDDLEEPEDDDGEWQAMPAFATHTIYDDWGKILAREEGELDEEDATYGHLGGAGKGYTKVQVDDDAKSATSMDDDTAYLFKAGVNKNTLDEDEEGRDMLSQMEATKDMLTEGQRIAYVGVVRLCMIEMTQAVDKLERTKGARKQIELTLEAMKLWSQKMMVRLFGHMEIDAAEQIMIEQLAEHGVQASDLTPPLMQNVRVKNPVESEPKDASTSASRPSTPPPQEPGHTPQPSAPGTPVRSATSGKAPPPYDDQAPPDFLSPVKNPSELAGQAKIDIDLRWTVLCDLFLVLVADSAYDSRSRSLLEKVGKALSIPWIDICRFEKRVTDALEMQEAANKENWNEEEHMVHREKSSRNRKLLMMGLATVGGGLVIGLSAGLLAPVIGAGLAAGFTTIGVAGTSTFLSGAGAAALITTGGIITGGTVGVRSSSRRMGAVKTYEYRPLYNNKRVNLVVTIAGWMTGKVDDVRLPFSTVDPIMGDIYSVHWEPEMLQSMGQTINILATEVGLNHRVHERRLLLTISVGIDTRATTAARKHHPHSSYGCTPAAHCAHKALISDRQPLVCISCSRGSSRSHLGRLTHRSQLG